MIPVKRGPRNKLILDPVDVLVIVAKLGSVERASRHCGLPPKALRNLAWRLVRDKDDWHLAFALQAGLYMYRYNRSRRLTA